MTGCVIALVVLQSISLLVQLGQFSQLQKLNLPTVTTVRPRS